MKIRKMANILYRAYYMPEIRFSAFGMIISRVWNIVWIVITDYSILERK